MALLLAQVHKMYQTVKMWLVFFSIRRHVTFSPIDLAGLTRFSIRCFLRLILSYSKASIAHDSRIYDILLLINKIIKNLTICLFQK